MTNPAASGASPLNLTVSPFSFPSIRHGELSRQKPFILSRGLRARYRNQASVCPDLRGGQIVGYHWSEYCSLSYTRQVITLFSVAGRVLLGWFVYQLFVIQRTFTELESAYDLFIINVRLIPHKTLQAFNVDFCFSLLQPCCNIGCTAERVFPITSQVW